MELIFLVKLVHWAKYNANTFRCEADIFQFCLSN